MHASISSYCVPTSAAAPVVEEHTCSSLRTVDLAGAARARDHRHVVRERLAGRVRREQRAAAIATSAKRGITFSIRHDRDVDARQRRAEPAVALVRDEHERAGVGGGEVHAGDADVGLGRNSPQPVRAPTPSAPRARRAGSSPASRASTSRICGSVLWIAGVIMCDGRSPASCTMYSPRSVSTRVMPVRFERVAEVDLLGRHRLALHDACARPARCARSSTTRRGVRRVWCTGARPRRAIERRSSRSSQPSRSRASRAGSPRRGPSSSGVRRRTRPAVPRRMSRLRSACCSSGSATAATARSLSESPGVDQAVGHVDQPAFVVAREAGREQVGEVDRARTAGRAACGAGRRGASGRRGRRSPATPRAVAAACPSLASARRAETSPWAEREDAAEPAARVGFGHLDDRRPRRPRAARAARRARRGCAGRGTRRAR